MGIKYRRGTDPPAPRASYRSRQREGARSLSPRRRLLLIYVGVLLFLFLLLLSKPYLERMTIGHFGARQGIAIIGGKSGETPDSTEAASCMLDLHLKLASGRSIPVSAQVPCAASDRLAVGDRIAVLYRFDPDTGAPVVTEVGLIALPEGGQV